MNYNSTARVEKYSQGSLGIGYINNKGSVDSNDKTIRFTFDNNVLGVLAVERQIAVLALYT